MSFDPAIAIFVPAKYEMGGMWRVKKSPRLFIGLIKIIKLLFVLG